MARTLTPIDVHAFMNALVHQATGQSNVSVVDTSTFISAGETVLATGMENTINSLAIVIGRTLVASRPYSAKLRVLNALDTGAYTSRLRKISFYAKDAKPAGDWNTDLYTNLHQGYDNMENGAKSSGSGNNSTKSQWEQNPPVALEMNFGGVSVWQDVLTTYKYQLKQAFRSESEFGAFIAGVMTEKAADIEQQKESYTRAVLLNGIAATYNMDNPGSVVNLTKEFNDTYGTTYTSAELRTTYAEDFLKFCAYTFKQTSKYMTYRTAKYHWSPAKQIDGVDYTLLRHTPVERQKALMFGPMFLQMKTEVFPSIFNPSFIETNFETVDYWQSFNDPSRINVTPAQTNTSTGVIEKGSAVNIPYVVGVIFDQDAMLTDFVLDDAETTPMEARKKYYNTWYSMARNGIYDPTENMIVFVMEDE